MGQGQPSRSRVAAGRRGRQCRVSGRTLARRVSAWLARHQPFAEICLSDPPPRHRPRSGVCSAAPWWSRGRLLRASWAPGDASRENPSSGFALTPGHWAPVGEASYRVSCEKLTLEFRGARPLPPGRMKENRVLSVSVHMAYVWPAPVPCGVGRRLPPCSPRRKLRHTGR